MKVTKFQIITLCAFVLFIIIGVAVFATYKGKASQNQLSAITVWGTFPKSTFDQYVANVNNTLETRVTVTYVQESASTFLNDFVSALARGNGPDVVLIPSDVLLPTEDKLTPIPYSVLPARTFLNTFVDEAQVYLAPTGVMGVPFSIDPMVMYWNRDIYNSSGIAVPPKYWDEFVGMNNKLTIKDDNGTITRSAVAMGDFTNVDYARELLGTLILQAGNPVTKQGTEGIVTSQLSGQAAKSPEAAIKFFTDFVDPSSQSYSWNRSWPNSKTAFLSGKLSTYFGLASELYKLREKNPNLNFDTAPMPQLRSGGMVATYGRVYGFSIVKSTRDANSAYQIISILTAPQNLVEISKALYLPSVSRAVISSGTTDPYIAIFNEGALISRSWLDSDPSVSTRIFADLVQGITSGQKSIYQALNDAQNSYDISLRQALGQ